MKMKMMKIEDALKEENAKMFWGKIVIIVY